MCYKILSIIHWKWFHLKICHKLKKYGLILLHSPYYILCHTMSMNITLALYLLRITICHVTDGVGGEGGGLAGGLIDRKV
jgi:hypothetical protein